MADKVVLSIAILFVAFLVPYLFQWYRAHYSPEAIIDDVDVPDNLALHSEEFDQPNIIMVTKGIYVAIGYALANSILIEAPEGNIVVDTTEALSSAHEIRAAFRNVSDRPIKAIIYTHNHPDHTFGAQAFVDDPESPPDIWAHELLVQQLQRITVTGPLIYRRSARQFGRFLRPPAHVNAGIGPRLHYDHDDSHGLLYPNRFLRADHEDVIIAGLALRLVHIPGETADQMGVWLPEHGAFLCGDDMYRAFPNLYAVRGTPARDVNIWAASLDRVLSYEPAHLVPSHTKPLSGREVIRDVVTKYRDAIQYVHDQTVRWMNKGELPEDIARRVRLPDSLRTHPFLQEHYGTVAWSVRGVFDSYMGWFSGDVTELQPLGTLDKAEKMVDLGGGTQQILRKAQEALSKGELQWALELASAVFKIDRGHTLALKLRLEVLRKMAAQHTSANGRNYLLTVALEDHGLVDMRANFGKMIMRIPMQQLFCAMAARVRADECAHVNMVTAFNFTDSGELFTGHLRNGVFVVSEGDSPAASFAPPPDLTLSITAREWRRILGKITSPLMAYFRGDIVVEGGLWNVIQFFGCFDREL